LRTEQPSTGTEKATRAKATYDRIAGVYYTPAHPTSNAFDKTIGNYLRKKSSIAGRLGVHLDVGCGRSKLSEIPYLGTAVFIDLSLRMLLQSELDESKDAVVGSALHLPIANDSIETVYSFIGDAFACKEFFQEAFRVLKTKGAILEILPTKVWAETLRKELGISSDTTYFLDNGVKLFAPSIVFSGEDLVNILRKVGFSSVGWENLFLPDDFHEVPKHIEIPSKILGVDPYDLPLLVAVRAIK